MHQNVDGNRLTRGGIYGKGIPRKKNVPINS